MKMFVKILFICIIFLFFNQLAAPGNAEKIKGIAVIKAKYDNIENTLHKYGIPHKIYNYNDLENKEIYDNHRAIFFPCGVENTIETNVNILSRGSRIHSVSLKKDFYQTNEEKIYRNIKSFVEDGGNAYFSDYSYKLFNEAFKSMDFFDDFPNIGADGTYILELQNDLRFFCKAKNIYADMSHNGWVAVRSISKSVTLAESTFNTIRGLRKGPVISLMKRGFGEAVYTSYHKAGGDDEITRYIIYRLTYKFLLDQLIEKTIFWDQDINCSIIDSIREWEYHRSYFVPVNKGNNTIYFVSNKGPFQIDVFDNEKQLIISNDLNSSEFHMNIKSDEYQLLNLKIYPSNPKLHGVYSIVSAEGIRFIPYCRIIMYFLLSIAIIMAVYWINKTIGIKKFSGRIRQK
ncbi:MAG: hypothetical protein V1874_15925 [Spirochaetota bacterium]